jgi:hypothetical protein
MLRSCQSWRRLGAGKVAIFNRLDGGAWQQYGFPRAICAPGIYFTPKPAFSKMIIPFVFSQDEWG